MAAGQKEGVAVSAREPRAAESALGLKALGGFPWLMVPTHNLAHDSSHDPAYDPAHSSARDPAHDPARDPARDPAKGGYSRVAMAVWR